jgi:hypothetical protein
MTTKNTIMNADNNVVADDDADTAGVLPELDAMTGVEAEVRKTLMKQASFPRFDPDDFRSYQKDVMDYLKLFGQVKYIKPPTEGDEAEAATRRTGAWQYMSRNIYKKLMSSLGQTYTLYSIGAGEDDAASLWSTICKGVARDNHTRRVKLDEEFTNLVMTTDDPLGSFLARFDLLRVKCRQAGLDLPDETLHVRLYKAVPEVYRNRLDGMRVQSYGEAINVLREYDALRSTIPKELQRTQTLSTTAPPPPARFRGTCYKCQQPGHKAVSCPSKAGGGGRGGGGGGAPGGRQRKTTTFQGSCRYCDKKGHREAECRFLRILRWSSSVLKGRPAECGRWGRARWCSRFGPALDPLSTLC